MMKILVYTQNHEPGGGNRYLTDFLNKLPHEFQISLYHNEGALFPADQARLGSNVISYELPVATETRLRYLLTQLPFNGPLLLAYKLLARLPAVRKFILRERSKRNRLIFRQVVRASKYSFAIAFNGGFPAGLSCFDFLAETQGADIISFMSVVSMPTPYSYADTFYSKVINHIDYFFVNCEAIKQALADSRGIQADKINVLYNVVEAVPVSNSLVSLKPWTEVRFGFIGRIEKSKGVYILVKAFNVACTIHSGISLKLFGKIKDEKKTKTAISKTGCRDLIYLAGIFTQNVFEVLIGLDVLILPSLQEGFPYVIIEAMAAGLPVIATDVGGIREAVLDGKTGILVRPGDQKGLTRAIVELATNHALRAKMGTLGKQRVEEIFAPNIYTQTLFDTLARSNIDMSV